MSIYFNFLRLVKFFKCENLELDQLPDIIFENIAYDKPYFTHSAGVLNIFMNFSFDRMRVHKFSVRTENPELYIKRLSQSLKG